MYTLYKKDKVCRCADIQLDQMLKAGWSKDEPKVVAKDASKDSKSK